MRNKRIKSIKRRTSKRVSNRSGKSISNHGRYSSRRKLKGGGSGSDIRHQLVTLCKRGKWAEYDALTQKIMYDYWRNGKKDFFVHLDRHIHTFTPETLACLKQSLTQLQEDAIPESMPHLYYIMKTI